MFRRLMGLVLIISVVLPLILGVVGVFVVRQIVVDLESAASVPLEKMNRAIDSMKGEFEDAKQAFDRISNRITGIVNAVQSITSQIPSIPTSLTIPRITIPDPSISVPTISVDWDSALGIRYPKDIDIGTRSVSIPIPDIPEMTLTIPGLSSVKNLLSSTFGFLDDIVDSIKDFANIKPLIDDFNEVVAESQSLITQIRSVVSRWLNPLVIIALVIVIWLGATYIASTYERLRKGWEMLRG
jgi:predicted PurR-regulated permease PerM